MAFYSIIIPTFNSAKTIVKCLQSILEQSFQDFEVLIQDGGSSDQTLHFIAQINDHRIKCVSQKDAGVYDAMNKAIMRSNGQWLYFLGSDDSLYSMNTLEEVAKKLKNSNCKVWYGDVKVEGNKDHVLAKANGLYRGATPLEELFEENICHQAMFFCTSIFKRDGYHYNLTYPVAADYMLNLELAAQITFEYMPIIVANYSIGGLSNQIVDHNFYRDQWPCIITRYGMILSQKRFSGYKSKVRRGAKALFKNKQIMPALKGMLIYVVLKVKK